MLDGFLDRLSSLFSGNLTPADSICQLRPRVNSWRLTLFAILRLKLCDRASWGCRRSQTEGVWLLAVWLPLGYGHSGGSY